MTDKEAMEMAVNAVCALHTRGAVEEDLRDKTLAALRARLAEPVTKAMPELRQIVEIDHSSDMAVSLRFTSCRAASSFFQQVKEARWPDAAAASQPAEPVAQAEQSSNWICHAKFDDGERVITGTFAAEPAQQPAEPVARAEQPVGYFIEVLPGKYEQAADEYKDDADVIPLYRKPPRPAAEPIAQAELDPKDLRVECYDPNPGGQRGVPTRGMRVTHIPTSISVVRDDDRSQHRNRVNALAELTRLVQSHPAAEQESERAEFDSWIRTKKASADALDYRALEPDQMYDALRAARAAIAAQPAIPAGYALVPVETTEAMLMDAKECREAFEAWADEKQMCPIDKDRNGGYLWAETNDLWQAWQAARRPVRELSDGEILRIAADHDCGYADGESVKPFDHEDGIYVLRLARAILAKAREGK